MAPDPTPAPVDRHRVLVLGGADALHTEIQQALEAAGYLAYARQDPQEAFDIIYNEPPDAIVLCHGSGDLDLGTFPADLKGDNVFSHLPVILVLPRERLEEGVDWTRLPVDDYVLSPLEPHTLVHRLEFTLARTRRDLGYNPLTRLPGNESIVVEIQNRLDADKEYAFAYVDVDHFKAFNDAYGFARGDEVLRMLARVLVNAVRPLRERGGYVGHVGGDDFVIILPLADAEGTCAQIIGNFDLIVPTFYNEADRARGHIASKDRRGNPRQFPLMTVTVAIVPNPEKRLTHFGQVSTIAAELKAFGKTKEGSNVVVDRRGGSQRDPDETA